MFTRLTSMLSSPKRDDQDTSELRFNVYATVGTLPPLDVPHRVLGQRDLGDPDLHGHLEGFIGYVLSRGDGEMTRVRYHLMRHLQRVQHHVSLSVAPSALPTFLQWAGQANAVVFHDDGSVRDTAGRVLIDSEGNGDPAADVPYPADALARKAVIEAELSEKGIHTSTSLPPVVGEAEAQWRTPADVVGRVMALLIVSAYAEGIRDGERLDVEHMRERLPDAFPYLSPDERAFLQAESPDEHLVTQMGWRYESMATLAWAAGLWPDHPDPDTICDVAGLTASLLDDAEHGMPTTRGLRLTDDILDALDMTFRTHWVIREAELGRRDFPPNVIPGVIQERHHALNWLVRFEQAEWDDVTTPT